MEPNPCASTSRSAWSVGRARHANGTARNHTTTPRCFLSCTAATEQDVPREKPHSHSKSPPGVTRGGGTGHLHNPGATRASTDRPSGQLVKITRCMHGPKGNGVCSNSLTPSVPAHTGLHNWEPGGKPQPLPAAGTGHAGGGQSQRETCAGAAASAPGSRHGWTSSPPPQGPRSTPASPLPRIPLWSCPSPSPRHSSAVTWPKNSRGKNHPNQPNCVFQEYGHLHPSRGSPGHGPALLGHGTAQTGSGPRTPHGEGFAEPPPAPAQPRRTNCSLRRASAAAAGAWTSSVASN